MYMRRYLCLAGAVFLCACSTTTRSPLPDGRHRVAVNSRVDIDNYIAKLADERSAVDARSLMERQLASLRHDVDTLKRQLATMQMQAAQSQKRRLTTTGSLRTKAATHNAKALGARPSLNEDMPRTSVRKHEVAPDTSKPADSMHQGGTR